MISSVRKLLTLVILLAISPCKASESFAIKGEHVSQVFAAVCAENHFAEYQAWSLKYHFMLRQFDSPNYQISRNEIKDDELLFSVTINEQNKWQAKLRDQKFVEDDPCEVANAFVDGRTPKQISLLTFLIPEARAEKLVNHSTAINWLLGALATAAVTDGAFIDNLSAKQNLSNSFLLSAAFRSMNTVGKEKAQTNFDKLLNQRVELMCSRNRVKIYGKDMHVVVKKGYVPFRLGFVDNKTGKPLRNEPQVLQVGKVHEHLLSLGQRCNHDGDSDSINAQIQAERDLLNMKIARAALLNRSVSSSKNSDTAN